jgi:small subunit ribosomal protein S16
MALKIRLARGGARNHPFFSIVVADSRFPRDGRFIEKIGTYNPRLAQDSALRITLNAERIKHWISVGAKPSDRVAHFMFKAGLGPKPEYNETPQKSAPKAKAQERLKAAEEKAAKPAEAPAAAPAAEAAAAPAEAPAEAAQG